MKKNAFTLAEVLICLTILGVIAAILIGSLKTQSYNQKAFVSNARKIVDNIQNASFAMLEEKADDFPLGTFVYKKTKTSFMYGGASTVDSSAEIVSMYGNYIKYEKSGINFCDNTAACSGSTIKGARIPGGAYIGFYVNTSLFDCDCSDEYCKHKIPDPKATKGQDIEEITGPTGKKCWGTLYIDVNGNEGPNVYGEDYYHFPMGENGVIL